MMSRLDVEIVNVTKEFGDFTAVSKVSLGVQKGEFLTLLGPSGCGKTTTLRMVGGFIRSQLLHGNYVAWELLTK